MDDKYRHQWYRHRGHARTRLYMRSTVFLWCLLAGGGVHATTSGFGSAVILANCTIDGNTAHSGGDPLVFVVCGVCVQVVLLASRSHSFSMQEAGYW